MCAAAGICHCTADNTGNERCPPVQVYYSVLLHCAVYDINSNCCAGIPLARTMDACARVDRVIRSGTGELTCNISRLRRGRASGPDCRTMTGLTSLLPVLVLLRAPDGFPLYFLFLCRCFSWTRPQFRLCSVQQHDRTGFDIQPSLDAAMVSKGAPKAGSVARRACPSLSSLSAR